MCAYMGAENTSPVYYCNSRWLSQGNILSRVHELRRGLHIYMSEEKHASAKNIVNKGLIFMVYLCDIFEKLNKLNVKCVPTRQ